MFTHFYVTMVCVRYTQRAKVLGQKLAVIQIVVNNVKMSI